MALVRHRVPTGLPGRRRSWYVSRRDARSVRFQRARCSSEDDPLCSIGVVNFISTVANRHTGASFDSFV